jgi:cystathionine gamma-synthase
MKLETLAVHLGREVEQSTGAVSPSITLSTTFAREADGALREHVYTRSENPNRNNLERTLAALEGGASAIALSSGMASADAILQALAAGDHVIAPDDIYHGVRRLMKDVYTRWGLEISFVDFSDAENVARAMRQNTKLIWVETPSNPQMKVSHISRIAQIAHESNAVCVVDNTFATPINQSPLAFGADVVMHATTKFIGGHSDVLGGCLIFKQMNSLYERVRQIQTLGGGAPSPFDCWLLQRSIPTLPMRVRAQSENAMKIAEYLSRHPRVSKTHYPGLPSHPNHDIAIEQMYSFGGMLSFEVVGGWDAAMRVANRCKVFTHATSLGGVESLIEHRRSGEGPDSPTPEGLLRVSVGIEHIDDLIADLEQALMI